MNTLVPTRIVRIMDDGGTVTTFGCDAWSHNGSTFTLIKPVTLNRKLRNGLTEDVVNPKRPPRVLILVLGPGWSFWETTPEGEDE